MTSAALVLGDLNLIGDGSSPYLFEVLSMDNGTTFGGGGAPIEVQIASLLQDGARTRTTGVGNREVRIAIQITASDLASTAEAEALLMAEMMKPNTLTWTPPDGWGRPGVFEVETSFFENVDNDLDMVRSPAVMSYTIRLVCLPWARSVDERVTVAVTIPDGSPEAFETILDECTSLTNWTTDSAMTISVLSGVISVRRTTPVLFFGKLTAIRSSLSTAVTAGEYLFMDYRTTTYPSGALISGAASARFVIDGSEVSVPGLSSTPTPSGFFRVFFEVPTSGTLTKATLLDYADLLYPQAFFNLDRLGHTNVSPFVGSSRQRLMSVEVGGSVRTQAALKVSSPSATSLGDGAIVFTYKDDDSDYQPALRVDREAGGNSTSADATAFSGTLEGLSGPFHASVPIGRVPRGRGFLCARLKSTEAATLKTVHYNVVTQRDGNDVSPPQAGDVSFTTGASGEWMFVPLARLQARELAVKGASDATIRFSLYFSGYTIGNDLFLDDLYWFSADQMVGVGGVLSVVDCGDATILSLETATTDEPWPHVFTGTEEDGSDWLHALDSAMPAGLVQHEFSPPGARVFVATAADDVTAELRSYDRWHTFPAA